MHKIPILLLVLCPCVLFAQPSADAELTKALAAYDTGNYEQAMVHADSAIALNGELAAAYKLRGDIHQRQQDLAGAMADYRTAIDLNPDDPRAYVSRSAARITEGNLKGAIKDLDRALELDENDPDAYYNRACTKYMGGDIDGALKDAQRALKLRPDLADALFLSGVVKGERYREEAGMAEIQEALRLKPDIPGGVMSLAMLLYETGQYTEAIDRFTEVIDSGADGRAEAFYYRGDCQYELGNKELACADWEISANEGDKDAVFIVKNYCSTDAAKIPKKPERKRQTTVVHF